MDNETAMKRFAERISDMRLDLFTGLLRRNLAGAGVDEAMLKDVIQATTLEMQIEESRNSLVDRALHSFDNRGIDSLGRIVVEYCFVRAPMGTMIWPEYSDEDTTARWDFVENVLPRPLMRYFLISVRGTIQDIDGFSTPSYLFESQPEAIEDMRRTIGNFLDEFKGPFGHGESAVDWQAVYEDQRFREVGLQIISAMRSKLEHKGLEEYLGCLKQYRRHDPNQDHTNLMQRTFSIEDAQQIQTALINAEKALGGTSH